ncbi:hypothetical protein [Desulfurobacterium sp.]
MKKKTNYLCEFAPYFANNNLLTRRELAIVICILDYMDNSPFLPDAYLISKRTRIAKNHIHRLLKQLPFIKKKDKAARYFIDVCEFRKFIKEVDSE